MTFFGKILVFAHLVLSMACASLALGIVTNRIDWPGTAKAAETEGEAKRKAEGVTAEKKAEIDKLQRLAIIARIRWQRALPELLKAEQERPLKKKWYAEQLAVLSDPNFKDKISSLVYLDGKLQMDKDGLYPLLEPVASRLPLQPIPILLAELRKVRDDVNKEIAKIARLVEQEEKLTLEINGEKGKTKGLRDLIAELEKVEQNALAELEYLRPLRYNRQVESELLLKRKYALESRLKELENIGVALRQP